MASSDNTVIVLVDDDAALLGLLAELLAGQGRTVDTVCGADGLSVDMLALSQPSLVLLNPTAGGLTFESGKQLVEGVRKMTGARIILMVDAAAGAKEVASRFGADAGIETRVLLRDPLLKLQIDQGTPSATAETTPAQNGLKSFDQLGADDILGLDLTLNIAPPPSVAPVVGPIAIKRDAPAAIDLAKLIDEELAYAKQPAAERRSHFSIMLDTSGDDALFAPQGAPIGVFVATALAARVGDQVDLDVSFPWGQKLSWKGKVAWLADNATIGRRRKPGLGIELKDVTETDRQAMTRLNTLRLPMQVPKSVRTG